MKEEDNFHISRLCYIFEQRRIAELALSRANYRVAYYRKIEARLDSKEFNENLELAKKIEAARLTALKKQQQVVNLKEKTKKSVNAILKKVDGVQIFNEGKVIGIKIKLDWNNYMTIPSSAFADKAADYEATIAMNRMLSS